MQDLFTLALVKVINRFLFAFLHNQKGSNFFVFTLLQSYVCVFLNSSFIVVLIKHWGDSCSFFSDVLKATEQQTWNLNPQVLDVAKHAAVHWQFKFILLKTDMKISTCDICQVLFFMLHILFQACPASLCILHYALHSNVYFWAIFLCYFEPPPPLCLKMLFHISAGKRFLFTHLC